MPSEIENLNPFIFDPTEARPITKDEEDESVVDPFDAREIFGK